MAAAASSAAAGAGAGFITAVYSPGPFTAIPRFAAADAVCTVTAGDAVPAGWDHAHSATVVLLKKEDYIAALTAAGIPDSAEAVTLAYGAGGARTIFVNVGATAKVGGIRNGVASAVTKARAAKLRRLVLAALPATADADGALIAATQGAVLANYAFDRYLTAGGGRQPTLLSAVHVTADEARAGIVAEAEAICRVREIDIADAVKESRGVAEHESTASPPPSPLRRAPSSHVTWPTSVQTR